MVPMFIWGFVRAKTAYPLRATTRAFGLAGCKPEQIDGPKVTGRTALETELRWSEAKNTYVLISNNHLRAQINIQEREAKTGGALQAATRSMVVKWKNPKFQCHGIVSGPSLGTPAPSCRQLTTQTSMSDREELIRNAVAFLADPKVSPGWASDYVIQLTSRNSLRHHR